MHHARFDAYACASLVLMYILFKIGFLLIAVYVIFSILGAIYIDHLFDNYQNNKIANSVFWDSTCSVCFGTYDEDSKSGLNSVSVDVLLPCRHVLHSACRTDFYNYFLQKQSVQIYKKKHVTIKCPVCRTPSYSTKTLVLNFKK